MNLLRVLALFSVGLLCQGRAGAAGADDAFGTPGQTTHRMAGIGVILSNDVPGARNIREHMIIRVVVDGSPAMKQGLQVGDQITAIDDTRLAGRNFAEAVNTRLRGELDSIVTVTIRRAGVAKQFTVPFVRKVIPMIPKTPPRA
jgi:C-terminal processing protease CtpA/Prc